MTFSHQSSIYGDYKLSQRSNQCQLIKTCDIMLMKLRYLALVCTFFAITVFCAIPDISSSSIRTYPILLLNLYHPQCEGCKHVVPQLNQLYELTAKREYQVAQINCAQQEKFCNLQNTHYPAIFLYVEGNQIIYEGAITAEAIDSWFQSINLLDFPKLTPQIFLEKQYKQAFLVFGGLNKTERIQLAATKLSRYIGIEFYEIQTTEKAFSLYLGYQQKNLKLHFPINTRLFAYQLFHRTRDRVMSVSKPEYLDYFRKQAEGDHILIFYDHHDQISIDATPALDKICNESALDILCFRVQKQSQFYEELVGNFVPFQDRSSLILSKASTQRGYLYRDQPFIESQFRIFLKDAKDSKRNADFDYIKESKDRMKSQNVLNIDDKVHNQLIRSKQIVFVEYYSPFFKNCSSFVSSYEAAGKHFKQLGSQIVIASVDADEFKDLASQQFVSKFPAFKVFISGQGFDYEGEKTTEAIIDYLTSISKVRLLIVPNLKDIRKPAVAISGIAQNSPLHKLPVFFNSLPFYFVTEERAFKIVLLKQNGEVEHFNGERTLTQVLDWLQEQTGPVLVSLGDSNVPKKLKAGLKKYKLILGLVNKGEQGSVDSQIQLLNSYCQGKKDIVCGTLTKGEADYEHLVEWISDPDQTANRLVVIDHKQYKCFIFSEDIKNLNIEKLNDFVQGIKNGTVPQHRRGQTQEENLSQNQQKPQQNQQIGNQQKVEKQRKIEQL